jgi:hypothetical protein
MDNSNIVFKSEIKTASTERLRDRLDTLIRATEQDRKQIGILNLIEEAGSLERELSKRNALYPVYPFSKFPKVQDED